MYGADLHSKVKSCVRTVHTLPLEAEELLATGCPVDMEVSANVTSSTLYPYYPLSTRAGSICNSTKSNGQSIHHRLRKRSSFNLRGFEGSTPTGKNKAWLFHTPNLTPPAGCADPELPLYLGRDERLMCR